MADQSENIKKAKKKKGFSPAIIIWILILGFIAYAVASGIYIVDAKEQAVITRFGKYTKTEGPGLHIKMPFGIDKAYTVAVEAVQNEQFGFRTVKAGRNNEYKNNIAAESRMLTGDLNIIDVEWDIQYRIVDPKQWLFGVNEKQQTIRDISQSVINTLIGDRAILDIIVGNERTTIQNLALEMMNENYEQLGLGIKVFAVNLQNAAYPPDVLGAYEDVNKATQDMNRLINEGKEAYNREIPLAQGEANRLIKNAEGYATERVNIAKGDVAKFNAVYSEYKKAPKVTKERIYIETMEEIFGSDTKPELIDGKLENLVPVKNLKEGR